MTMINIGLYSNTAVLCAKFQNDTTALNIVTDERYFTQRCLQADFDNHNDRQVGPIMIEIAINIPVKLPWIFPGAPLKFNGATENIKGNLDRYRQISNISHT